MTDLTDYMTEDRKLWENHNSPGAAEGRAIVQKEDDILQKQVDDKARTAYDATDLGASGPPEGDYDYRADYEAGNTLVPDEDGGITLNNKQFKPAAASVAGTDLVTGKQYTDHWKDEHGDIAKGRKSLSEGQFNTLTGATYDQTDGLFDVANGMIKEGATFKEYQDQVVGPWNNDQMGMAWHAAISAHQTMQDIDTQGRRYYDELRENYNQFEGVVHSIPAGGYTEASLSLDKDWIKGSRRMGEFLFGAGSNDDKTDEQIAEAAKMFISQTRNNIDMTVLWANRIINENDPELARTWLALDAQYDAMDITSESIGRFATAQMNVTNLLTFGGGILITQLGKFATGQGIKNAIRGVAYGTAYDATLSGAAGVAENLSRQNIEIVGEARTKVDPLEATFSGVLSAGAGVVIGGTVNVASNKTVRDYAVGKAGDAVNFMGQNMSDLGIGPMPGSPAAQRGSMKVGEDVPDDLPKIADEYPDVSEEYIHAFYDNTPEDEMTPELFRDYLDIFEEGEELVPSGPPVVSGDQQVMASFKLQQLLGGVKDGAKPITVRENIKAAINKGLVTEQEVKWSRILDHLDDLEHNNVKVIRGEMIDIVEGHTPKPKIVPVKQTQYMNYSLNSRDSSMFENYDEAGYIVSEPNLVRAMERDFAEKGDTFEYQLAETGEWHSMSGKDAFQSLDFHLGSVPQGQSGELAFKTRMTNANTGEVQEFPFVDDLHDYMWARYEAVGTDVSKNVKYDEHMLVLPSRGAGAKVMAHFPEEQINTLGPDDTMIGHSRIEAAELDGKPGKMVLEIQSDYHKEGQKRGYLDAEGNPTKFPEAPDELQALGIPSRIYHDVAVKNGIDPYEKNAMTKIWPLLDEEFRREMTESMPDVQPFGKDWDAMGMRLEIMDSINKGDEFVAFPASGDQISVIEQWGAAYGDDSHSIVKRATGKRVKALEKMGIKVEQVDMPQYKTTATSNSELEWDGDVEVAMRDLLFRRRQLLWYDSGDDMYVTVAYPNQGDWDTARAVNREVNGYIEGSSGEPLYDDLHNLAYNTGDLLNRGSSGDLARQARAEGVTQAGAGEDEMSTLFNVIRLTDELKAKFRKEGMNMYSAAPVAGVAASEALKDKPARKRDGNGRFSK